jgi:hypothetical protein
MRTVMKDADFVRGFCECVKAGMTTSQAAEKMGLSASNIGVRAKNLREKYNVNLPELKKSDGKVKDTAGLNYLIISLMASDDSNENEESTPAKSKRRQPAFT